MKENFKSELKELLQKYNAKVCIYYHSNYWDEEDTIAFEEDDDDSGDILFESKECSFSADDIN